MDDNSNPSPPIDAADPVSTAQGKPPVEPAIDRASDELLCDLLRARGLLRDAMLRLTSAFGEIVNATDEVGLQLERMLAEPADAAQRTAAAEALRAAQQRLRQQADQAMLGLQVEDVLGQLIEHTHARVGGLSDLAAALAQLIDRRASMSAFPDAIARALAELDQAARVHMVSQESLDSGDVELF